MMRRMRRVVLGGLLACWAGGAFAGSVEERLAALEARLEQETSVREEQLLKRINELERQISQLSGTGVSAAEPGLQEPAVNPELMSRMNLLEDQVASLTETQMNNPLKDIGLGGYGELHYNGLRGSGGAADKREIDFHRFVLMISKDFSERVRFVSELELEHVLAGEGQPGEVELEQAYVDFDLNDRHTARAGLFLLPVGLLNETHEPPRFYGVERNPVENNIIPTTWWEGGVGLYGRLSDTLNYAAYIHSGLAVDTNSFSVRNGRQKVAKAVASDPAATIALNWNVPGITVGGSMNMQSDVTQGINGAGQSKAVMGEVHLDLQRGPWGLSALYAEWALSGSAPEVVGADRQYGWFIEPSYRFSDSLGFFARYNQWNNQAGGAGMQSGKEQINVGVNWWPHEQVVLKADYQWQNNDDGKNQNGINLGAGYEF